MLAFWPRMRALPPLGARAYRETMGLSRMTNIVKTLALAGATFAAMTTHAAANVLIWTASAGSNHHGRPRSHGGGHHGGGHHGGGHHSGGGAPSAPEIDISQGAAALVIVLIAFLLIREAYLRQRVVV